MGDIAKDLPTPWLGTFERVNAYTLFAWMAVLAVVLLRRIRRASGPEPGGVRAPAVSGQPIGNDEESHATEQAPLIR